MKTKAFLLWYALPFYLLSACDFLITADLARSRAFGAAIEWNPLARPLLNAYDLVGLAAYKLLLASGLVMLPLWAFGRRKPAAGRIVGLCLNGFMVLIVVYLLGVWSALGPSSAERKVHSQKPKGPIKNTQPLPEWKRHRPD